MISLDISTKISFVEILSETEPDTMLWPCVYFARAAEFTSRMDNFIEVLHHGEDEALQAKLDIQFSGLDDESDDSKSLVYLLGKDPTTPHSTRLIIEPPQVHSFSDKVHDAIEQVRLPDSDDNFSDALKAAMVLVVPRSVADPSVMYSSQQLAGNNSLSALSQISVSTPELSAPRAVFVPINVPGTNQIVSWPGILFHKGLSLIKGLIELGLACESEKSDLQEAILEVRESGSSPPFCFLFGRPPSASRIITVEHPQDLAFYSHDFSNVGIHKHYYVDGYWDAYHRLMFAIAWSPGKPKFSIVRASAQITKRVASHGTTTSDTAKRPANAASTATTKKTKVPVKGKAATKTKRPPMADISNKKTERKHKKSKVKVSSPDKPSAPTCFDDPWKQYEANRIKKIPTFEDAKPFLERAGYTFRDGLYCLPGKDPLSNTQAVMGQDYFISEEDLRRYLCFHHKIPLGNGLRPRGKSNDKERPQLEAWVRYCRVAKLLGGRSIADAPKLSAPGCRYLLENKLGFDWSNGWQIPGNDDGRVDEASLKLQIGSRGLPQACDISKITEDELLGIEMFYSSPCATSPSIFYAI